MHRVFAIGWLPTAAIVLLLSAAGAFAADPPPPNPKQPVDYVKFLNDGFSARVKDNAAELYLQAAAALGDQDPVRDLPDDANAAKWTSAERDAVRKRCQELAPALDKFCAAARKPDCYFTLKSESGAVLGVLLPETAALRNLARLLVRRACLRLLDGETASAVNDLECLLRAARHVQSQPLLIQTLVGVGMYGAAEIVLDAPVLASKPLDYKRAAQQLFSPDLAPRLMTRQVIAEKLQAWDMFQRYALDRDGDGRCDAFRVPAEIDPDLGEIPLAPPQPFEEIVREVTQYFERVQKAAAEPDYAKARPQLEAIGRELAAKKGSVSSIPAFDFSRAIQLHHRAIAIYRGAFLVLRLHAHHAEHGRWPGELKDVLAGGLPGADIDPFSGRPFVYRVKDDVPWLYSVGENCTDDGGEVFRRDGRAVWGETGDYVFWPRQ